MPPRKKDRPTAVCPRCGNNFCPQGRSAEVKRSCRAKTARTRAQKQPPAGAGGCVQAAPMGERRAMGGVWCREGAALGTRWDRGARPGAKTAPARAGNCVQAAPHGEWRTSCAGWCLEGAALGFCRGREHIQAQKQPPAGAGGCLDAGYGCYLPRAIRVIWMHRVGSTARPRIMPS